MGKKKRLKFDVYKDGVKTTVTYNEHPTYRFLDPSYQPPAAQQAAPVAGAAGDGSDTLEHASTSQQAAVELKSDIEDYDTDDEQGQGSHPEAAAGKGARGPVGDSRLQQARSTPHAHMDSVTHKGGCHCGAVRWKFSAPRTLTAWDCNCSICAMKRNTHVIVPGSAFQLLQGEGEQTCYQFNTKTAKHLFCRHCGVCSYYIPRSNPSGVAITIYCIDPGTVDGVEVKQFDGVQWEEAYQATGISSMTPADATAAAAAAGGGVGSSA